MPIIDKNQWFDCPDSLVKRPENEGGSYYNVQGRFADHPVINIAKSRIARHNVHDFSITFYKRVLTALEGPATKNSHPHPIRFDKGIGMRQEDFDIARRTIQANPDAWAHYCKFRQAPVTDLERMALGQIDRAPLSSMGKVLVDVDGELVPVDLDTEEAPDPDDQPDLVDVPDDGFAKAFDNAEAGVITAPPRKASVPAVKARARAKEAAGAVAKAAAKKAR